MQANFRFALYSLFAIVALASCGQKPGYQKGSDLCSSELISDYNSLKTAQYSANPDYVSLRAKADAVKAKYKDVSCRAESLMTHTERTIHINSEIDSVMVSVEAGKKAAEEAAQRKSRECTTAFISDTLEVVNRHDRLQKLMQKPEAVMDEFRDAQNQEKFEQTVLTRDAYVAWQKKYKGVSCEMGKDVVNVDKMANDFHAAVGVLIPEYCPAQLNSQMSAASDALRADALQKTVVLLKAVTQTYPAMKCVGNFKDLVSGETKLSLLDVNGMLPKVIQVLEDAIKNGDKNPPVKKFGTALNGDLMIPQWDQLSTI